MGAENFNTLSSDLFTTPYSKVLQQNKFLLIFYESVQGPRAGCSFCLG